MHIHTHVKNIIINALAVLHGSCSPRQHAQQAGAIDQAGPTRRSSKLIARLLAAPD
jgi:hypothetical protein